MPLLYTLIEEVSLAARFLYMLPVLAMYLVVTKALDYVSKRETARMYDPDEVATNHGLEISEEFEISLAPSDNNSERYGQKVATMFAAVYGLEYFIFPTLVDRANTCPPTASLGDDGYARCWMAYNLGVTASRASLAYFRWRRLWLLVVFQAANLALWILEVYHQPIPRLGSVGYVLMYIWMIWVGMMGGCAYANCIHEINTSPRIHASQRDVLVNFAFGVAQSAILGSSVLGYALDQNVLSYGRISSACPSSS